MRAEGRARCGRESLAAVDLAGVLARQDPRLAGDVVRGARALAAVEGRSAGHLRNSCDAGVSSLRLPLAAAASAR